MLNGYLNNIFGDIADLWQWNLLLIEQKNGYAWISKIEEQGNYSFPSVDFTKKYSLMLLNQNYQLSSVLSFEKSESAGVLQYFKPTESALPSLTYSGPILKFSSNSSFSIDSSIVTDVNGNGIPDGMEVDFGVTNTANTSTQTSTSINTSEHDSDKDGINDRIDRDDDNDFFPDFIDTDSNGNNILDILEVKHDQFYTEILSYMAPSIEKFFDEEGLSTCYLSWSVGVQNPESVLAMSIIAPDSLLENSIVIAQDQSESSWGGELFDDGMHNDLAASDGIFGVRIRLSEENFPKRYQIFINRVTISNPTLQKDQDFFFPGNLPDIKMSPISLNVASFRISIKGDPFGENIAFQWTALVLDENDNIVFFSPTLNSLSRVYNIPVDGLPQDKNLRVKALVSSPQRITSYPAIKAHTPLYNLGD